MEALLKGGWSSLIVSLLILYLNKNIRIRKGLKNISYHYKIVIKILAGDKFTNPRLYGGKH